MEHHNVLILLRYYQTVVCIHSRPVVVEDSQIRWGRFTHKKTFIIFNSCGVLLKSGGAAP